MWPACNCSPRRRTRAPDYMRNTYEAMRACDDVAPTFRKHPASALGGITNLASSYDDDVDLDYHVRQSALPAPGRIRELLELTSRLHGSLLDRHRPLWEPHLIEGLTDGRFAVYTKMHHAIVDGVSGLKLMQGALSRDPDDTHVRVPWSPPPRRSRQERRRSGLQRLTDTVNSVARLAPSTAALARGAARTAADAAVSGATHHAQCAYRRCAAQSWPLGRIKDVKNAARATINDVVLAMCAGALRAYLTDQDGCRTPR